MGAIALALGGCAFAPRYALPTPSLSAKFKDATAEGAALPADEDWWRSFNDATLDNLQAQVDAANPDLAAAIASNAAQQARAEAALSGLLPNVDAVGHVTANRQSNNRPLRSANQPTYYGDNLIGAKASYEVDIWGRVRDIASSANATAEAATDALAQARLELHAELARDYIELRGLDDEAKLISDTIGIYRSAFDLTKSRLAAQIASPVDVDRAQAQLSSAEAQGSDLALRRAALENAIAALVGQSAASFTVARAARPLPLPARPRAVPADVLRRRPDVAEAERLTAAANFGVGAARANFFPRVTLIALGGTQDTGFRLFNPGNTLGAIGPTVDLPLFDAGLRQAELDIAKAGFTEAAETYRSTVLRSVKEVQDDLSALRWLAAEQRQSSTAAAAARRAADLSLTLYRDGASSYLDVVTAQSTALEAERLTIALHTRELESDVGLMLALGGGWTTPPEPAPRTIDVTPPPVQMARELTRAKP
ncbi:efflux transporter outer membrane subunit [Roseiarcus fermentans]|nr:efflux transporter outer membrane subunit [Roseiarcus fermentans]